VIFNLIGKKLEKSGKAAGASRMRDIAKALGSDEDDNPDTAEVQAEPVAVQPTPVEVQPRTFMVEAQPAVSRIAPKKVKPAAAVKNVSDKRKEKIDPKKLVVYSEIMKPKFTE
jgi:CRISPR/Cas system endoribonuclease Cas6 (RAMP superfamily)